MVEHQSTFPLFIGMLCYMLIVALGIAGIAGFCCLCGRIDDWFQDRAERKHRRQINAILKDTQTPKIFAGIKYL